MGRKRKTKFDLENNRYGLFMTNNSFELDVFYGRNYLNTDVNFIVKVYRINIIKSKMHNLYGQAKAKDKKYFVPIEIHAMVDIEDNNQENYGNNEGGIVREDTGNLILKVYLDELEEKELEINRGDVIEYNLSGDKSRFYEVDSANNVVDTTSQTIASFKPYWKKIIAVPAKADSVVFLKGDSLA